LVDAETVRYERVGAAALITIARPQVRNAIDGPTAAALGGAYARFAQDPDARVLVLTGEGEQAFCAGADLKALPGFAERLSDPGGPLGISRLVARKPTIAAIAGYCLAGGLELALWCDLRIAAQNATFGCTERRFGVPLIDGGTQRLPRIVGLGRALDLILSGRLIDAQEAHAAGLVSEVVATGRQLERALELAQQIAAFPQEAMLADRAAALAAQGLPLREGLELEAQSGERLYPQALAGGARFASGQGRGGAGI
jgi:enoyl-CoA hydratase